jgi:ribonuclease D
MRMITTTAELKIFCDEVRDGEYITVDTEFLRDKTYFPKLCLLQIASPEHAAIIDPLAADIDLSPVGELMQKKDLVKVFHAARQDIEIFYLLWNKVPVPMFDTQVAAAVCGYGESAGYETLVNTIAGKEIDKSSRFTDWSARPLSEKQLNYALSDVTHLCTIYEALKKKIEATSRTSWIEEEHAYLSDPKLYTADPDNAWQRLKFGNMRPKNLAVLRELARWREIEARKNNVPRGRILKDDTIIELAFSAPKNDAELSRMRNMDRNLSKDRIAEALKHVQTALALPASDYPQSKSNRKPTQNITSAMAMLQLLLKVQSDVHHIAAPMIANKEDLEAIALSDSEATAMHGWRYDIFGKKAKALMEGKLKLSLNAKNQQVVFEEG